MKRCEWCGKETTKTIFIEIRHAHITTNDKGNFKRHIRASRTVPCCSECYKTIERADPKRFLRNKEHTGQMDLYEVLKLIEGE